MAERIYIYLGDRNTEEAYRQRLCTAVLREDGKCVRSKNGNMLVIPHLILSISLML